MKISKFNNAPVSFKSPKVDGYPQKSTLYPISQAGGNPQSTPKYFLKKNQKWFGGPKIKILKIIAGF